MISINKTTFLFFLKRWLIFSIFYFIINIETPFEVFWG
nr:MAG TPA: hypothetical protein [Bacteriophage sp.]